MHFVQTAGKDTATDLRVALLRRVLTDYPLQWI